MAYEIDGPVKISLPANSNLASSQYYFVKMVSGPKVDLCAAVTDVPVGILQNDPASGKTAEVMVVGISKLFSAGSVTLPGLIGTNASGQGAQYVPGTDTTKYIVAQALMTASANDIFTVLLNAANPHRAA